MTWPQKIIDEELDRYHAVATFDQLRRIDAAQRQRPLTYHPDWKG